MGKVSEELVKYIMENMSVQGLMYFVGILDTFGTLNCVIPGKIPHPVHFRDGMHVRNMMRESGLCDDWTAHEFDDYWEEVVIEAIKLYKDELEVVSTK